jgi:hypothetical protein
MFTVSAVPVVQVPRVPPLLFSPQKVSHHDTLKRENIFNDLADSKQARDLVAVLTESKQQIDPRLAEMARFGGGGGGGRYGGGRGGRGGHRGGGGFGGSNGAPMGGNRRW